MISYTITVPQTAANIVYSKTGSGSTYHQHLSGAFNETIEGKKTYSSLDVEEYARNSQKSLWTIYSETKSNGEKILYSLEKSYSTGEYTAEGIKKGETNEKDVQYKTTYQTNGWQSFYESNSYSNGREDEHYISEGTSIETNGDSIVTEYQEETRQFTYTFSTTNKKDFQILLSTTQTQQVDTTVLTTSGPSTNPKFALTFIPTTITIEVASEKDRNITFVDTYETVLSIHSNAPRATATVFVQGGLLYNNRPKYLTDCVWIPTASDLSGPGPWALTDIASSFTATTALPIYKTSLLKIVDTSQTLEVSWVDDFGNINTATDWFPVTPEPLPEVTETFTTLTQLGVSDRTTWGERELSGILTIGFPLKTVNEVVAKYTTTQQEKTLGDFTENNPALTEETTIFGTRSTESVEIKNHNLTYQQFYLHTFSTTRHAATFSETYSTSYNGPESHEEENGTLYYINVTVNSAEAVTIYGTNVEQVFMVAYSPCAVSQVETTFIQNWGLHGTSGLQPKSKIDAEVSFSWKNFVSLAPGVAVPYPSSESWTSSNSSFIASILGDGLSITTFTKNETAISSTSSTYKFKGTDPAFTEQSGGGGGVTNLMGLPAFSFFGPHAATESIQTRARPGTYVSIIQDSLGEYTLSTLTYASSNASTISGNAILFPAENSFYTTVQEPGYFVDVGVLPALEYLVLPRNPMP